MGIFHRNKTPPPPASEGTAHGGLPVQNTGNTNTTYTPTNEVPAPQYTANNNTSQINQNTGYTDGIQTAPPPAAGYNEKTPAVGHGYDQAQTQQQQQYTQPNVYGNQDPNVLNSGYNQHQQVPPPHAQEGQQGPGVYSQTDFHAQDKNAYNNQQQQHQQQQFQQNGRHNYQQALPLRSLQQGPEPVDCPVCGVREITRTEFTSGGTTHLSALLCCVCLCLGCIPYLATWFKDCEHYCGNCGTLLAVWHRSGHTEVLAKGKPGPAPGR